MFRKKTKENENINFWSTMSQESLNGLAICSIEKNILDNIDLQTVIDDFASKNV